MYRGKYVTLARQGYVSELPLALLTNVHHIHCCEYKTVTNSVTNSVSTNMTNETE